MRFNSPPNWPPPPPGWTPPPGWQPDPSWGPPPQGWQLWVPDQQKNRTPLIVGIVGVLAVAAIVLTVLFFTVWSKGSDEDQIREVVAGLQDAYNDSDAEAFKGYLCAEDLEDSTDSDNADFGPDSDEERRTLTVESVDVNGDQATAAVARQQGSDDRGTEDLDFVREDGEWKACFSTS